MSFPMISRIYIDNYCCLVNFEIKLEPLTLYLGTNGSGKSAVFSVLRNIQELLCERRSVIRQFPRSTRTRWVESWRQTFEIDIKHNENDTYTYHLVIEHDKYDTTRCRIIEERLSIGECNLFHYTVVSNEGKAHLYHDDGTDGPSFLADWSYSTLATVPTGRPDNTKLTWFMGIMAHMIIVAPHPPSMSNWISADEKTLNMQCTNVASWYYQMWQNDPARTDEALKHLQEIIPNLKGFPTPERGPEYRELRVDIADYEPRDDVPKGYSFAELSDGQRMLFTLYMLLYFAAKKTILCIDEPDNFLSLYEVQPWLSNLEDFCGEKLSQAFIISHHPEVIDFFSDTALLFARKDNKHTGVKWVRDIEPDNKEDGLPLSELFAGGWID